MDPATVRALRDAKALHDEGILDLDEFKAKKAELLAKKAPAPSAAPAPAKKKRAAAKAAKKEAEAAPDAKPASEGRKAGKAAALTLRDGGASGVLVAGPGTFRAKGLLSSLGGTWSKALKAWVFGADTADRVAAALRDSTAPRVDLAVEACDGDAAAARAAEVAAEAAAAPPGHAALSVSSHKRAVLVSGDTKAVKSALSALGGSWNRKLGGWVFPGSKRAEVIAALRADATNTVTAEGDDDAAAPRPPPENADAPAAPAPAVVKTEPDADADAKTPAAAPRSEVKTKASRSLPAAERGPSPAPGKKRARAEGGDAGECLAEDLAPGKRSRDGGD